MGSWVSLWSGLLSQSAVCISELNQRPRTLTHQRAVVASSLVLSRAAWEAFLNEFIEYRSLPRHLKNNSCEKAITRVHSVLEIEVSLPLPLPWSSLVLLNNLRNRLIHYKADSDDVSSSESLVAPFVSLELVPRTPGLRWEEQLLIPRIAVWACETVAASINALEAIPIRRTRAPDIVASTIAEALRSLRRLEDPLAFRTRYR